MKKILTLVLCAALLCALAVPAAALTTLTGPSDNTITAPKGTPAIDGVYDVGVYSDFYALGYVNNPGGADGKLAVAWDDDNLYFYIEVNDKTPFHDNETDWQTDNVEFFIDWNNHKGDHIENDDQPFWQTRIHSKPGINEYGVTAHANNRWTPSDFDAIKYVVVPLSGSDLSNGYIIEAAFPRSAVEGGMTLSEGKVLGFDTTIGDAHDDFDRAASGMFYNHDDFGMTDDMWTNPSALKALLVLGAAPAPAVVDEPEVMGTGGGDPAELPAVISAPAAVAPRTADPVAIFAIGSIISAAGVVIARKRK